MLDRLPPALDPRRRMARQPYFAFHLAMLLLLLLLFILLYILGTLLPGLIDTLEESWLYEIVAGAIGLLLTLLGLTVVARRCHDIGWTGWAALLIFIPFLGTAFWLALFVIPGTRGQNAYGPDSRFEGAPSPD